MLGGKGDGEGGGKNGEKGDWDKKRIGWDQSTGTLRPGGRNRINTPEKTYK